jgi:hypothetical protein
LDDLTVITHPATVHPSLRNVKEFLALISRKGGEKRRR